MSYFFFLGTILKSKTCNKGLFIKNLVADKAINSGLGYPLSKNPTWCWVIGGLGLG